MYGPKRSRPFPASAFLAFETAGDEVSSSYLSVFVGRRRQQIVVRTSVGPNYTEPVLNLLFRQVNTQARLDFPLDLTVSRETIEIALDGRSTPFTAYVCGGVANAEASSGGRTVKVDGPVEALRELELTSLRAEEITQMIQARKDMERRAREEFRRSK